MYRLDVFAAFQLDEVECIAKGISTEGSEVYKVTLRDGRFLVYESLYLTLAAVGKNNFFYSVEYSIDIPEYKKIFSFEELEKFHNKLNLLIARKS